MAAAHECAIWEHGDDALHLTVGVPSDQLPTDRLRTAVLDVYGENAVLSATSSELLQVGLNELTRMVLARLPNIEARLSEGREQRYESTETWTARVARLVLSTSEQLPA